jgi:hypothetical protein
MINTSLFMSLDNLVVKSNNSSVTFYPEPPLFYIYFESFLFYHRTFLKKYILDNIDSLVNNIFVLFEKDLFYLLPLFFVLF